MNNAIHEAEIDFVDWKILVVTVWVVWVVVKLFSLPKDLKSDAAVTCSCSGVIAEIFSFGAVFTVLSIFFFGCDSMLK